MQLGTEVWNITHMPFGENVVLVHIGFNKKYNNVNELLAQAWAWMDQETISPGYAGSLVSAGTISSWNKLANNLSHNWTA